MPTLNYKPLWHLLRKRKLAKTEFYRQYEIPEYMQDMLEDGDLLTLWDFLALREKLCCRCNQIVGFDYSEEMRRDREKYHY